METREFSGFEAMLVSHEAEGQKLLLLIDNATRPYNTALEAQDSASDNLLQAEWRVNRLSKASVDAYNSLVDKKNAIDYDFKPPMDSKQYAALTSRYNNLTIEAKAFISAAGGAEGSVFGAGNAFSRTSVDAAMGVVNSMSPVSFKTRQSVAKYVPPLVMGAIDLGILAILIIGFAWAFFHFRRFFRSKLAISGWVLTLLGAAFILVVGSVGVYSIVLSSEKLASYSDFASVLQGSQSVAIIVEKNGASDSAFAAMQSCASQIESQLKSMNKTATKYVITGDSCTLYSPKANGTGYDVKAGTASACLNTMPDLPVFDLQYSAKTQVPAFSTVVAKQAIVKANESYYNEKPMCDIANVIS
jgi:hypothetical protein